jgi:hypothetical protein
MLNFHGVGKIFSGLGLSLRLKKEISAQVVNGMRQHFDVIYVDQVQCLEASMLRSIDGDAPSPIQEKCQK